MEIKEYRINEEANTVFVFNEIGELIIIPYNKLNTTTAICNFKDYLKQYIITNNLNFR